MSENKQTNTPIAEALMGLITAIAEAKKEDHGHKDRHDREDVKYFEKFPKDLARALSKVPITDTSEVLTILAIDDVKQRNHIDAHLKRLTTVESKQDGQRDRMGMQDDSVKRIIHKLDAMTVRIDALNRRIDDLYNSIDSISVDTAKLCAKVGDQE
ncbi:MAG: hypothetical protein DRQ47_07485 [Gammaproteobacteria bacterium]|nr:MAG: hypothetical protein DRQ47_07485 [Gammaproteobacteria bacterium]